VGSAADAAGSELTAGVLKSKIVAHVSNEPHVLLLKSMGYAQNYPDLRLRRALMR
jgi:hypothetical protein